jgi:hypothetical protein
MLGDTISDCQQAKQWYRQLRAYDYEGASLKAFDASTALTASWLMTAWYGTLQPASACANCATQIPEVCLAGTRRAIVDAIAAYFRKARPSRAALVSYLGNDALLLATALEKEPAGEPLRAWMTLAGSVGAAAGTSRILGTLIYWAKGGLGDAAPATRAHALKAIADTIGSGTDPRLVHNIYEVAGAIQTAAAAKAAQTGDKEWQTVAGEAAAAFGSANLVLAAQAAAGIAPLPTDPVTVPWSNAKPWLEARWPWVAAGGLAIAAGGAAVLGRRRRR